MQGIIEYTLIDEQGGKRCAGTLHTENYLQYGGCAMLNVILTPIPQELCMPEMNPYWDIKNKKWYHKKIK